MTSHAVAMPIDHVDQLNSVDGGTYQSLLPQPSVEQFGLVEMGYLTERWRSLSGNRVDMLHCWGYK